MNDVEENLPMTAAERRVHNRLFELSAEDKAKEASRQRRREKLAIKDKAILERAAKGKATGCTNIQGTCINA